MKQFTVETYNSERCVVARDHGVVVEVYACGDLTRAEAMKMAKQLAREYEQAKEESEYDLAREYKQTEEDSEYDV